MRKLTTEEFIEKAKKVHGDKYDYSQTEYIDSKTKICIMCPIHGKTLQIPNDHLNGYGCKFCFQDSQKLTTSKFIERANIIHNNKYNYEKTNYINSRKKVLIICPIHGEFWQTADGHLRGQGCTKCSKKIKTTEEFIKKAKEIHGDKYNYSLVKYINTQTKILIICPIHGTFEQYPENHLRGHGCKFCQSYLFKNIQHRKFKKKKYNNEEIDTKTNIFIEEANKIHKNKYNYSKIKFINHSIKICIICPIHGEFWQTPSNHLQGKGCNKCYNDIKKQIYSSNTLEFIDKAKKIHGETYNYSLTNYIRNNKKVIIICKIHGPFNQSPCNHLNGNGCPNCKKSNGELKILNYLKSKKINFEQQKKFPECKNNLTNRPLFFDFYLENLNICIEYDGEQHFKISRLNNMTHKNAELEFENQKYRDNIKNEFCKNNNIKLIRIPYWEKKNIEIILDNELKEEI